MSLQLATVEDQARGEVARANDEAAEARNERDDALKALHAMQLEEKEWRRREDGWKAVVRFASCVLLDHSRLTFRADRQV